MKTEKEYIKRKTLIYKTDVEYGDYTINHILGCSHGCKYPCYAYLLKKRFGEVKSYEDWCKPRVVENTLELLGKEIPKFKDKIRMLHLCFTTDPFMYGYPEIQNLSIAVIKKLNVAGIKCSVLTKGILPIALAELNKDNEYGITLVSLDEEFRVRMEPGSASINKRLASLRELHDAGCKTWVSIEPYPTPNICSQNLKPILEAVGFVDRIIFGRMNYSKEVTAYKEHKDFYNKSANETIKFCEKHGISFHIKNGTITD